MEKDHAGVMNIYQKMFNHFGPRGWWPGETPLEVCVGAILTQSVSWQNVTKAINNLKEAGLMDLEALYNCTVEEIEVCIVPTLYFRMKAKKLKAFVKHVGEKYDGNLSLMFNQDLPKLRLELLGIYGIGPETADSIILYAAEKPVFVIDAYTKRIFSRLGLFGDNLSYGEMQELFMNILPLDVQLYNEYHALIVGIGNNFCRGQKPKCTACPLSAACRLAGSGLVVS